MPNWCEGWVKFRGTKANVVKMIVSVFDGAKPEIFDDFVVAQIPTERVIRMRSLVRAIVEVADIEHANYSIWTNNEKALFIIIKSRFKKRLLPMNHYSYAAIFF